MSAYRDDVAALAARHQALASEVEHKTRELEETTRLLDDARTRARLPVLDNLRIASPCTADWNQMTGDDRVRACALCEKDVFNLSELTREEAEALILEKAGDLCARYYQRHDGTILLKDCTVGVAQKRKRRVIAAGALAMLGGGSAWAAFAEEEPDGPICAVQGGATTMEFEVTAPEPPLPAPDVPQVAPEPVPVPEPVLVVEQPPPLKMGRISIHRPDADEPLKVDR